MRYARRDLIQKIFDDTGFIVKSGWSFNRPTLNWAHKSAGRMAWYWYTDKGVIVGSAETMSELLKSERIVIESSSGFVEFSSS